MPAFFGETPTPDGRWALVQELDRTDLAEIGHALAAFWTGRASPVADPLQA